MQSEMQKPSDKLKTARRAFSAVGFSALLLLVGELLISSASSICIKLLFPADDCPVWLMMLIIYICTYGIAFPLAALPLRRLPAAAPEQGSISARHFLAFLPILYLFGCVGSYLGIFVGTLLENVFNFPTANSVAAMMDIDLPVLFFITVILAPVFEEWFFRKLLIDRTRVFGEKLAVLVSALLFAFIHTNLYQFFYAFLIGLVFGYIYLRTGKVTVTMLMHAVFNLFGLISTVVLRISDIEAALTADTLEAQLAVIYANPIGTAVFCIYSFLCLALLIGGILLLFKYRKKIFFKPAEMQLPPDTEGAAAFINIGMPLFIVVSAAVAFILGSRV